MAMALAVVGLATLFMGAVVLWPSSEEGPSDRLVPFFIFHPVGSVDDRAREWLL